MYAKPTAINPVQLDLSFGVKLKGYHTTMEFHSVAVQEFEEEKRKDDKDCFSMFEVIIFR